MSPSNSLGLLALGDHGADAGRGVEAGDAGAAGADALGQRALRVELELELAGEVLPLERSCSRRRRSEIIFLICRVSQQQAEAEVVDAAVVRDDVRSLTPAVAHGADQLLGNAAQAEAAGHQHHAVARARPSSAALASG